MKTDSAYLLAAFISGATCLVLLAWAAGAIRAPRVFLSRHAMFYLSVAFASIAYVSILIALGRLLRNEGGSWGWALEMGVFAVGTLAYVWVAMSTKLLRRLRVFISTHFYRDKFDYRVEWLRFVQTLTVADDPDLRRTSINAVAQIFGSPGGFLLLREEGRDRLVVEAAWPEALGSMGDRISLGPDDPLVRFVGERQWVVDLKEYAAHPQRYEDIKLPEWLDGAGPWRLVVPLLVGRELLGILVLRSPPEPFVMTFEDRDLLKTVGRHVAVQLAQRNAVEKLAESRQFDAYNRLTAFVMHDLKNSVAQLQLLVANAARYRRDPAFVDDAISTIANAVERMTHLIEQLQSRDARGLVREVDMAACVRAAIVRAQSRQPAVVVLGKLIDAEVRADPDRLSAVLDHVIRNAQEATIADREPSAVSIEMTTSDGSVTLIVADEGVGMDDEFVRDRLFRPFDSTKGSKGMGIGAFQVREYVRSLGGDVEVESAPGRGTRFYIRLGSCQKINRDC